MESLGVSEDTVVGMKVRSCSLSYRRSNWFAERRKGCMAELRDIVDNIVCANLYAVGKQIDAVIWLDPTVHQTWSLCEYLISYPSVPDGERYSRHLLLSYDDQPIITLLIHP